MKKKRHDPYQGDYVPKERIKIFLTKHNDLWQKVYADWQLYQMFLDDFIKGNRNDLDRLNMRRAERLLIKTINPNVAELMKEIQAEFHYMDSTVKSGGLLYRLVRIYEESPRIH